MTDLCCILHFTVFIIFQAIQNHHGEQCASEVSQLKELENNPLFINFNISAKLSYRANNNNIKN